MLNDYEIARQAGIRPIGEIATKLGVEPEDLMPFGHGIGKVNLKALTRPRKRPGHEFWPSIPLHQLALK